MKIVIAGGGIAGPVVALCARRAGMDAVVCEAESVASEGAFLGIAPNGMNVLASLGLEAALRPIGHVSEGFRFLNERGETIGAIDQRLDAAHYGQPMLMVRRRDLHALLLDAAERAGATVLRGVRVEGVEGTSLRSATGVIEGDLVVGADGIRSVVRKQLFPAVVPRYTQLVDFGGFTTLAPDDPLPPATNVMMFGRRAFFGAFATPRGEVWWFHNGTAKAPLFSLDEAATKERLLERHAGDATWVGRIIERTQHILGPWPMHVVEGLPCWHTERVCLIGDAAHAMLPSAGQGASLAMEDAMELVRCLADDEDVERALLTFERRQRPRVEEIAAFARRSSAKKTESNPVQRWVRDRMMATFLKMGAKAQARAHAHRIAWP